MLMPILGLVIAGLVVTTHAATNVVLLYSQTGQLVTSSTLGWQSFTGDVGQLSYAVTAGNFIGDEENYVMYVCRAMIDGIYTTGHTQKHTQKTVCIVSMHMDVRTHFAFDILINKGHGAKLTWKPWSKFTAAIPTGAVSAISAGHVDDSYVARRKVELNSVPGEHHHHMGPDYYVGRFAPKLSLGKVIVSEGQTEKEYDEGQILAEAEPTRYVIRDIVKFKLRTQINRNRTELGSAVLVNDGDYTNLVETVISYSYDKVQYWGTLEGVSRGLPTMVYEQGKPVAEINWGLTDTSKEENMKTVSTNLQPGTALNVTMVGNYTRIEAPYKATLVSFYAETNDSVTRKIESTVVSADMLDVKFEFSPVYWRHNFTLVPTTTTTTTTTTTSTTPPSTPPNSKEAQPAYPPPMPDDVMGNDIAAEESRESVTEDKYKLTEEKLAAVSSAITHRLHIFTITAILLVSSVGARFCVV